MSYGKILALFMVALATALLVYALSSRLDTSKTGGDNNIAPPPDVTSSLDTNGTSNSTISSSSQPDLPLEPPRTAEQRERDAVEDRRAAFYSRLHQDSGGAFAVVRPSASDGSTLEIYAKDSNEALALDRITMAIRANASYYGFRHIVYYSRNDASSVDPYHLDAEANADGTGKWATFKK